MTKCSKDLYKSYLIASSVKYSGLGLSEIFPEELSHDTISQWLKGKNFRPSGIWSESLKYVKKDERSILICDDTVLDKNRSEKIDIANYQYSGTAHKVIKGIGIVNMLWHGLENDVSVPVDYRIYNKNDDGKSKNTHFLEMLKLAKSRGLEPEAVVMDSWYSSLKNLKAIRDMGFNWVTTLRKNRKVNRNETLEDIEIPNDGAKVHLRGYGWVKVFRFVSSDRRTDYVATNIENCDRDNCLGLFKARWAVEIYHRELKQTCGIQRCQARAGRSQRNHICLSILAWFYHLKVKLHENISCYKQKWNVTIDAVKNHIIFLMNIPQT